MLEDSDDRNQSDNVAITREGDRSTLSDLNSGSGRQPIVDAGDGPIVRLAALIQVNADRRVVDMRSAGGGINTAAACSRPVLRSGFCYDSTGFSPLRMRPASTPTFRHASKTSAGQ
jgi:hypothetical protein